MTLAKIKSQIKDLKESLESSSTPENFKGKLKDKLADLEKQQASIEAKPQVKGEVKSKKKVAVKKISKKTTTGKKKKTIADEAISLLKKAGAKSKAFNKGRSSSEIVNDSKEKALAPGKRVSHAGVKNQYGTSKGGHVYYENRANRSDVSRKKYPYLEEGGEINDEWSGRDFYGATGMDKIKAISKENPTKLFLVRGDRGVLLEKVESYWLKDGVFARAETWGNHLYDFDKNKASVRGKKDYKYKMRLVDKKEYANGGEVAEEECQYIVLDDEGAYTKATKESFKEKYDAGHKVKDKHGKIHDKSELEYEEVDAVIDDKGKVIAEKEYRYAKGGKIKDVSYTEWEGEVTDIIVTDLDCTHGDAAGIVEANDFEMNKCWGEGLSAKDTAEKIKKSGMEKYSDGGAIKKTELTYSGQDDNGRLLYKGANGERYAEVDGVIHSVTSAGEPDVPAKNVVIKDGEPIYNTEDRFGRNVGSKVQGPVDSIPNNYKGKTAEQIWDAWTKDQKEHFLMDHEVFIRKEMFNGGSDKFSIDQFSEKDYSFLPFGIKDVLDTHISEGEYKKGGVIQNPPQGDNYTQSRDKSRIAKPAGWRFTNEGAEKLAVSKDRRPTHAQVEKYKGKYFWKEGVQHRYLYEEERIDKSDMSRKDKFDVGGVIPEYFGTGDNINVFGYQTEYFINCPLAVDEFEKAMDVIEKDYTENDVFYPKMKTSLSAMAQLVDKVLEMEADAFTTDNESVKMLTKLLTEIGKYNYKSGLNVKTDFLDTHVFNIVSKIPKSEAKITIEEPVIEEIQEPIIEPAIEPIEEPVIEEIQEQNPEETLARGGKIKKSNDFLNKVKELELKNKKKSNKK